MRLVLMLLLSGIYAQEKASEASTDEAPAEAPAEVSKGDAPAEAPTGDAPAEAPTGDAPADAPTGEAPAESSEGEASGDDEEGDDEDAAGGGGEAVMNSCPKLKAVMMKYPESRPKVADLTDACAEVTKAGDCKTAFDAWKNPVATENVSETCKYHAIINKCASWKKACATNEDFMECGGEDKTRDTLCPEFIGGGDCKDAVPAGEERDEWSNQCTAHHCKVEVATIMMPCIEAGNCADLSEANKKTVCDAYIADSLCAAGANAGPKETKDGFQAACGKDIVGKKLEKTTAKSDSSSNNSSSDESSSGVFSLAPAIMLVVASM